MHPYIAAAIGGVLIGISAVMLMALSGRIAGISGIIGGLLPPKPVTDRSWRFAFILGLVAAPEILRALTGDNHIGPPTVGTASLILAGLLVGAGTTLGGGCTSGHGICGISRISPRSIAAVATFMVTAVVTLFLVRHVLGG
ncbi:MAG TPA: YeeE/YedE family protein [Micropepsaceae bacterium]|nr:YeeE/YedE family protein [Micropepsaceae bacterium]